MVQENLSQSPDSGLYYSEQEGWNNLVPIFQGQGGQEVGMGKDLCAQSKKAAALYKSAEKILGYSPLKLTQEELDQTRFAQPAIFTYNEACRLALIDKSPITPRFYAGNSLGEYNAFLAAGAFTFEEGLNLVMARAEGMQIACDLNPGGLEAFVVSIAEGEELSKKQRRDFQSGVKQLTASKSGRFPLRRGVGLYLEAINSDSQVVVGGKTRIY